MFNHSPFIKPNDIKSNKLQTSSTCEDTSKNEKFYSLTKKLCFFVKSFSEIFSLITGMYNFSHKKK